MKCVIGDRKAAAALYLAPQRNRFPHRPRSPQRAPWRAGAVSGLGGGWLGLAGWGLCWHSCGLRNVAWSGMPGGALNMTLASANACAAQVTSEYNAVLCADAPGRDRALRSVTAPLHWEVARG